MTKKETSLHLGFLVEEIKEGLEAKELAELGLDISTSAIESEEEIWKVRMSRPNKRMITFSVRSFSTEGWGTDFQVMDDTGSRQLDEGYVGYLFTYLTWVLEQAAENDHLFSNSESEEFTWQSEKN